MTPPSSALPRQTQEGDESPSVAGDLPRHPQGDASHRRRGSDGCTGGVHHQPPSASDADPHHPQGGGGQASHPLVSGCALSSEQEPSDGATHAGEQRCRAGSRCVRRGDDGPVPEAGVLRPLARALLAVASDVHGAHGNPLEVGSSKPGSGCGCDIGGIRWGIVWGVVLGVQCGATHRGPGLPSRQRRSSAPSPRQWSTPTVWGGIHEFVSVFASPGAIEADHRGGVARRGVFAHRSGSGHPSSHPLASGAHLQPGLSHVLHGSQYRPASDDPSLRAAPRGALSTAASRSGERVPLRPRSPRCLDRRQ